MPHETILAEASMRLFAIPVIALGVLMGGYSDEPTEGQMKGAFEYSMQMLVRDALEFVTEAGGPEAADQLRQVGSDRFAIRSFRKLDCARDAGDAGYVCGFAVNIELMNGDLQRRMSGRFIDGAQGVVLADEV
jgi:hypothetical protein